MGSRWSKKQHLSPGESHLMTYFFPPSGNTIKRAQVSWLQNLLLNLTWFIIHWFDQVTWTVSPNNCSSGCHFWYCSKPFRQQKHVISQTESRLCWWVSLYTFACGSGCWCHQAKQNSSKPIISHYMSFLLFIAHGHRWQTQHQIRLLAATAT